MTPDTGTADPLTAAGYAPCVWPTGTVAGRECTEKAWPTSATWIAPGVLLATYGAAACGHTAPTDFIVTIPDDPEDEFS